MGSNNGAKTDVGALKVKEALTGVQPCYCTLTCFWPRLREMRLIKLVYIMLYQKLQIHGTNCS